jgi:osmoprotectant transport system ATP-binding protein
MSNGQARVAVENVSKSYGGRAALAPTTLEFAPGRTTVLIGPSGCGKSTLLRLLVGLIAPDTGQVILDDAPLTPQNVERRRHGVGYVIQDGGLFPHLTAAQNVALLARFLRRPEAEIAARTEELAGLVQLPAEALRRYPSGLSGGQRQRVGLMRALMLDPPLLLLDEPLGALDPITRRELQEQLKAIFARLHKTVVLVTHDMGEAAYFGDVVALMRAGAVVQAGTLDDLLQRPAEPYVTDFIRAQRSPLPAVPEAAAVEAGAR